MLTLLLAGCHPSSEPERDRIAGGWQVMVADKGKPDMLCYAGASPEKSAGSLKERTGRPYLMVTRRASGKMEISASGGYAFKSGSKVELVVGDVPHALFYRDDVAWARAESQDKAIIEAMKTARGIELRGVSQAGLTSLDTYSPQGFSAAIARVKELCP